jgi:hypothetical protein
MAIRSPKFFANRHICSSNNRPFVVRLKEKRLSGYLALEYKTVSYIKFFMRRGSPP